MSEKTEKILRSNITLNSNPYKTVGQSVWNRLQQLNEEHICLIDSLSNEKLTIGELKRQANSIAMALISRGITKSDRIAFSGQNSIQHSVLRFVAYFLGNTFIPLSPTFGKYEVEEEIRFTKANVIFSSLKDLHKFDNILVDSQHINENTPKLVVVFDGNHEKYITFEKLLKEGLNQTLDKIPYFDVNPEKDMFFLIYTSGSTDRPKCAMIPHRMLVNNSIPPTAAVGKQFVSIIAMLYPFGHMSGASILPFLLTNGATLVLFAEFNEELLFRCIEKYRINLLPVFPQFGLRLLETDLSQKYDLSSLQMFTTSGAAFPKHIAQGLIHKYKIIFRESYSMTEYLIVSEGPEIGEEFISGNTGRVAQGNEVKIIDMNTGESLGPNIDGEICIRGNKLFAGYLNNEKANKEAIDKDGWFHTGDIGHYDEKERIFITDRLKEVIRIGSDNHYIKISPVEIELFLMTHKSVADVVVVGVKSTRNINSLRAYLVIKKTEIESTSENDIGKYVSDTLSYTKHLNGGVVFVDHIHRTGIGKVDRFYYRNLVNSEILE